MSNVSELPPIKVAFVIDNEVVDVLHTDERLAAIFLSEPVIIDVTDLQRDPATAVAVGATYDPETKTFTSPEA